MTNLQSKNVFPSYLELCNIRSLWRGWERVSRGGRSAGGDGITVRDFEKNLNNNLENLKSELLAKTYRAGSMKVVPIPKSKGGSRILRIPCVRDRVVQASMLELVRDTLEAEMEPYSFAYRRGKSVKQAIAAISAMRRQGYTHVLDADIRGYFDNIPHDRLLARLSQSLACKDLVALVQIWLSSAFPGGCGIPQGAPISPILANLYLDICDETFRRRNMRIIRFADDFVVLCKTRRSLEKAYEEVSDLLSGLGLELHPGKTRMIDFDKGFAFLGKLFVKSMVLDEPEEPQAEQEVEAPAILSFGETFAGLDIVDQGVIPPPIPDYFPESAAVVDSEIETGLTVKADVEDSLNGTADQLFQITVHQSAPHQPSDAPPGLEQAPEQGMDIPEAIQLRETLSDGPQIICDSVAPLSRRSQIVKALYCYEKGRTVDISGRQFAVYEEGEVIFQIPPARLDRIDIGPAVDISSEALRNAMYWDVPVYMLNGRGVAYGSAGASLQSHAKRHLAQAKVCHDEGASTRMVRQLVAGRISNQRALLYRLNRRRKNPDIKQKARELTRILRFRLPKADSVGSLRGFEGLAGSIYWPALGLTLLNGFQLEKRLRREKTNPFSVLLDFASHLLIRDMEVLVRRHNLHPGMGMLHAPRDGDAPLAWDLVEPFRAPLADGFCVYLVNNRIIELRDMITTEKDGYALTVEGSRKFIRTFESWISREVEDPYSGQSRQWRSLMEQSVQAFIRHIETDQEFVSYEMGY